MMHKFAQRHAIAARNRVHRARTILGHTSHQLGDPLGIRIASYTSDKSLQTLVQLQHALDILVRL